MKKNTRREFLTKLGLTVGAVTVGKDIMSKLSFAETLSQKEMQSLASGSSVLDEINFRYAPANWQSTYCFPDDPYKSLVGKSGELLYGHQGIGYDEKVFPHVVSVAIEGKESPKYIEQKLETPAIPIITTKLDGGDVVIQLVSFATNDPDEGRVDNMLIEIRPKENQSVQCSPEIVIKSQSKFTAISKSDYSIIQFDNEEKKLFMVVNSPVVVKDEEGVHRYQLKSDTTSADKSLKFFVRFPQEGQKFNKIEDGLDEPDKLLKKARIFWQSWKPTEGKVEWKMPGAYQDFLVASTRNILQAREIKNGKKVFQVGPTVYRGLWVVDGAFLLEAARYLGYDKEAQEGLESIWDRQDDEGAIKGGAGEKHWKDTAVAVFALIRQAELSQNWDYFYQIYPDAIKALMYLKQLIGKSLDEGSSNSKYLLLPRGFGDSGIGGIRSELTNTIWALTALKAMHDIGERLHLPKYTDVRDFYGQLVGAFMEASSLESRIHPKGFSYLPMLMKEDPKWDEKDERKQPRPQVAQIYMSQAIYPGLLFEKDDSLVSGHIELMKAVTKEDIPIETGWLPNDAVWTYNAAIVAQVYLWAGMSELARKTFIGFLNHASPLYAWREEQSLQGAKEFQYIGDMPHNWASAEYIRYLRHMILLEDVENLRLFDGIGLPEMRAEKPISLIYSPTRWGRVTVTLEPVDKKTWNTKFKREDFDAAKMPPMKFVELPRKLPGDYHFDKINGATRMKNGERVFIPAEATSWECTWRSL